jgi:hypothetical protein
LRKKKPVSCPVRGVEFVSINETEELGDEYQKFNSEIKMKISREADSQSEPIFNLAFSVEKPCANYEP